MPLAIPFAVWTDIEISKFCLAGFQYVVQQDTLNASVKLTRALMGGVYARTGGRSVLLI